MSKYRPIIIVHVALLAIGALLCIIAADSHASQWDQYKTTCFNRADWNASVKRMPCTTIVRPDNDLLRVIQGTTDSELSECVISTANINDARCHRTEKLRAADHVAVHVNSPAPKRTCNPKTHVCAKVGRVQEDGSVDVTVYQFNMLRPIERCTLGSPQEERGRYRMPCRPLGDAVVYR